MSTITLTIEIEVPDGVEVKIKQTEFGPSRDELLKDYWDRYLSDSGRRLYRAVATLERFRGPGYTFEDIAEAMSITYESAKSIHRNTGRSAGVWRRDDYGAEPILLIDEGYAPTEGDAKWRTSYRLPEGVAEKIGEFQDPEPEAS